MAIKNINQSVTLSGSLTGTTATFNTVKITKSESATTSTSLYLENTGSGGGEGVSIVFNPMFGATSMIASNREGANSNLTNLSFHTCVINDDPPIERMRITSAGNVGIGTSSPQGTAGIKLDVIGGIGAWVANNTSTLKLFSGRLVGAGRHIANLVSTSGNGSLELYRSDNLLNALITGSGSSYFNGGNVGIGTATPNGDLQIVGNSGGSGTVLISDVDNGSAANDSLMLQQGATNSYIWNKDSGFISFGANNAERMRLTATGQLGIGTTTPTNDSRLHMEGGHGTTRARMYYPGSVTTRHAYIDMWASEPGSTYNGSGIGSNILGSPYYGKRTADQGMTYIRFLDGNFGIWTSTVASSVASERFVINQNGAATFTGTVAVGGATASAAITLADHTTAAGGIKFRTAASTVSLYSSGSGNLMCAADFNSTGRIRLPGGNAVADPDFGFSGATAGTGFSRAGQDITFVSGGSEKMRLTSVGIFMVGGTTGGYAGTKIHVGNFTDTQNGINILTSTTGYGYVLFGDGTGADTYRGQITYYHGDDSMSFNTNGSEKLRIVSGGGISFAGSTNFGSAGQVLKSNGSASPAWVDASSVIGGPYLPLTAGASKQLTDALWLGSTTDGGRKIFFTNNGSYAKGYLDAGSYGFQVSGSEKMTLTSTGLGIGTTSPQAALHVAGAFNTNAPTGNGVLMGYYNSSHGYIQLNGPSGGYIDFSTSGTDHKGRLLYDNTSNFMRFDTSGSERMRILSSGNVGIGTTSPGERLTVHSTATAIQTLYTTNSGGGYTGYHNSTGGVKGFVGYGATLFTGLDINNFGLRSQSGMVFATGGGNIRMYINSSGKIGIGTTSPQQMVHVVNTDGANIILNSNTGAENSGVWMTEGGVASPYTNGAYMHYDGTNNAFKINTGTTSLSTKFTILRDNGNVGIGTTTPTYKLQVGQSTSGLTGTTSIFQEGGAEVGLYVKARVNRASLLVADNDTGVYVSAEGGMGSFGRTQGVSTANINIDGSGNVGIGTISPVAALQVGSITATAMNQVIGKARIVGTDYVPSSTQMGTLDIASTTRSGSSPFNANKGPSLSFSQNISGYVDGYEVVLGAIKTISRQTGNTGQEAAMTFLVNGGTSTGVVERMRIEEDGNVGIGTTSPAAPLVLGNGSSESLEFNHNISSSSRILSYNRSNGAYRPIWIDSSTNIFKIFGVEKMRIDTAGKVGIGTTSPGAKLDVYDSSTTAANTIVAQAIKNYVGGSAMLRVGLSAGSTTADIEMNSGGAGPFRYGSYGEMNIVNNRPTSKINIVNNSSIAATINSAGNVGIGTTSPRGKLDIVGNTDDDTDFLTIQDNDPSAGSHRPSIRFRSNTAQIGQILGLDNSMRFSVGTTEDSLLEIASGGNVGIGTTSPVSKFEVDGSIKVTGITSNIGTAAGLSLSYDNGINYISTWSSTPLIIQTYNYQAFHISGSEKMRIHTNGNVGIGTASPNYKFVVSNGTQTGTFNPNSSGFMFLGSTSNHPLYFGVNDSTKMALLSNGNVGIGTTSPDEKLQVNGVLNIVVNETAYAAGYFAKIKSQYGPNPLIIESKYGDLIKAEDYGKALSFHTGNTATAERLRILSNGNVGIGTTSPTTKLELKDSSATVGLSITAANNAYSDINLGDVDDINIQRIRSEHSSESLLFYTNNAERLRINNAGNVGIGTTSPQSKLDVKLANNSTANIGGTISVGAFAGLSFGYSEVGNSNYRHSAIVFERDDAAFGDARGKVHILNSPSGSTSADLGDARLTILPDGNVGIGTVSPQRNLTIYESSGNAVLQLANNTSGVGASDGFLAYTDGVNVGLENKENGYLSLATNASEKMRITSGGNVGIGVTNPTSKLQVGGNIVSSGRITAATMRSDTFDVEEDNVIDSPLVTFTGQGAGGAANIGLLMKGTTATNGTIKIKLQAKNSGGNLIGAGLISYNGQYDTMGLGQNTTHNSMAVLIHDNGQVGIGTSSTDSTSKLKVGGNIKLTGGSVQVDNDKGYLLIDVAGSARFGIKMGAATKVGGAADATNMGNLLALTNRSPIDAYGGGEVSIQSRHPTATEQEVARFSATTANKPLVTLNAALKLTQQNTTPSDPASGSSVIWMASNGDLLVKITSSQGTTVTRTLADFS
mgnify:CR=1 FL=1